MDEKALKELRLASRLIICPHPETSDMTAKYLDSKACQEVASEFVRQSAEVEALYKNSTFESYLQSGMAALKTVFCSDEKLDSNLNQNCNNMCPCCNVWINEAGSKVPNTPRLNSFLRCRISGKEMNEYNLPVVLPNNQVYSYDALKKLSDRNNGIITCPVTGQKYTLGETSKIYLTS
jgi:macrophage erythroblast attacher